MLITSTEFPTPHYIEFPIELHVGQANNEFTA